MYNTPLLCIIVEDIHLKLRAIYLVLPILNGMYYRNIIYTVMQGARYNNFCMDTTRTIGQINITVRRVTITYAATVSIDQQVHPLNIHWV